MADILVTGGCGFIGYNLVRSLEALGHRVTVIDNLYHRVTQNESLIKSEILDTSISNFVRNDCPYFDTVFHLASITDTFNSNKSEQIQDNIGGFLNVTRIPTSTLIYASSASVYGTKTEKRPLKESDPKRPANVYAYTKSVIEELAESMQDGSKFIAGFRFFNVYGPYEKHKGKSESMISQIMRKVKNNEPVELFEFGEQVRDFVYVQDVVNLLIAAMEHPKNGVFNCGSGKSVSYNQILNQANRIFGKSVKPTYIKQKYNFFQDNTCADLGKTIEAFPWRPNYDLATGMWRYSKLI